jgi:predicted outer membrane repeat protein
MVSGGLSCDGPFIAGPTFTNSTFAHNTAAEYGGGVYCNPTTDDLSLNMANCVLWADLAAWGAEIALRNSVRLTTSFSDVQGGEAQVYMDGGAELIWGAGNIDADPLFYDPDGPDDDPNTWEDNDYRLSAGSPCIDAADNGAVPADTMDLDGDGDIDEPIPFDLAGQPRFVDDPDTDDTGLGHPDFPDLPIVDMGAYEFQACPADLDGDGDTDQSDLGILLADWGCQSDCTGDLDGDGDTDQADLGILLGDWGCGT